MIKKNSFREKSEVRKSLLVGFHTQFAENQRSREQSFLKFLAILAVPVVSYAYIYHYYYHPNTEVKIDANEIYFVQMVSSLLLFSGVWILLALAINFRRDQCVNAKIRNYCGLLGDDKVFPSSFDPKVSLKKQGLYKWIPEFLVVFYFLFVSFQAITFLLFNNLVSPTTASSKKDIEIILTISIFLSSLFFVSSVMFMPYWYRKKLILFMKVDKKEYSLITVYKKSLRKLWNKIKRKRNS